MNCWEILGVAETSDLAVIRKAYAAKAKEWHPEEYPEEFQRLQQAYRSAERCAKSRKRYAVHIEEGRHIQAENRAVHRKEAAGRENAKKEIARESAAGEETAEKAATEEIIREIPKETTTEATKEIPKEAATEATKEIPKEAAKVIEEIPKNADKIIITKADIVQEDVPSRDTEKYHEEALQSFDYEEAPPGFDYGMVEEVDLKDQFFTEFFSIAWNPYLMNNLVCWEYVLKRSPYDQLLTKKAFRYNFVRTACSLSGWQRRTILFFERWLQSRPADDEECRERKSETDLLCWKFKKLSLFEKFLSAQRCVTKDQKKFHDIFLAQVVRCGRDKGLAKEADVECYLSFYLPYAKEKQSKVKELYQGNCQGRVLFSALLYMVFLIVGMIFYVHVSVVPQMNERARTEAEQQRIQMQADEIKKYNEMLQEDTGSDRIPHEQEEQGGEDVQKQLLREYHGEIQNSKMTSD